MIEIIPAILPASFTGLESSLSRLRGSSGTVQIDVVDGSFAPTATWPYTAPGQFEVLASEDEALPLWDEFDFQFDVMANDAARDVEKFVRMGASAIIIHATSAGAKEALEALQPYRTATVAAVEVGIALMPDASEASLKEFEGLYDFVQVMGIARVGFQGEPFDERALSLVRALRAAYPVLTIQIDGGGSIETVPRMKEAGATRAVVGSAILGAEDPFTALEQLRAAGNPFDKT